MTPLELARRFHAQSVWKDVPFDADSTTETLDHLRRHGFLATTDTALCAGLIVPTLFNRNVLIAQELAWYAETPGEGKALRARFESWAKSQGARVIGFSILADEREPAMRRMMARSGYVATEVALMRRV